MSNHVIPENPQFSLELPKLKTTDRAHADIFNDINKKLIENDAYLEKEIRNIPKTPIDNTLTSDSETEALSAKQGKILNETKLSNKKVSEMSVQDLNNPNYPHNYEILTINGKGMGLPTNSAYIKYFSHDNHNGYGTQLAFKVDRDDQDGDNSKLWTMKIRASNGLSWGDWENVSTSLPKGHYGVDDANKCLEDGMHYYAKWEAANLPPGVNDCIISVYAYDTLGYANPHLVQLAFSWHQMSIHMRRSVNGQWSKWFCINRNDKIFLGNRKKQPNEPSCAVSIAEHNSGFGEAWEGAIGFWNRGHFVGHMHDNGFTINAGKYLSTDRIVGPWYGDNDPRNGHLKMDTPHFEMKLINGQYITPDQLFQSASNGKTLLANTLTGMGTPTSTTASWQAIADNIKTVGNLKKKKVIINTYDSSAPQYFSVEYNDNPGLGSNIKEVRLAFRPPKPIKAAYGNVVMGSGGEVEIYRIWFASGYPAWFGSFITPNGFTHNIPIYVHCIPESDNQKIDYVFLSVFYYGSLWHDTTLTGFRKSGIERVEFNYIE